MGVLCAKACYWKQINTMKIFQDGGKETLTLYTYMCAPAYPSEQFAF